MLILSFLYCCLVHVFLFLGGFIIRQFVYICIFIFFYLFFISVWRIFLPSFSPYYPWIVFLALGSGLWFIVLINVIFFFGFEPRIITLCFLILLFLSGFVIFYLLIASYSILSEDEACQVMLIASTLFVSLTLLSVCIQMCIFHVPLFGYFLLRLAFLLCFI